MPVRVGSKSAKRRHFIKQWRKARDLTQAQLAERVPMSAASLSRLENGEQDYTQGTLEALADALGTDPASLLMRDPTDGEALWSIWDQAKPVQRQQIIEIAKTITKTGTDR